MKQVINTGLPAVDAPLEWAVSADGIFYTAQIPIRADGSIETGDTITQARQTFNNLKQSIEAAGGTMADLTQVLIYITEPDCFADVNAVYQDMVPQPWPNRATIVAGLMVPGIVIEIVAYAHIRPGA